MPDKLFCYGCTKHYPAHTLGQMIKDARGNTRWCCDKCHTAKARHSKTKTISTKQSG
jgi:Zn-finger protein